MCDFNLSLFNYTVDKNTELLQEIPAGGYKVNIIIIIGVELLSYEFTVLIVLIVLHSMVTSI